MILRVLMFFVGSISRFGRFGEDSRHKPGSALLASLMAPSPPVTRRRWVFLHTKQPTFCLVVGGVGFRKRSAAVGHAPSLGEWNRSE